MFEVGVSEKGIELVLSLASLSGSLIDATKEFANITKGLPFEEITSELNELSVALTKVNMDKKCKLDFSVVGDLTYYDGIVFNGYVEGVAKTMLAGGKYDNLLKSLDKDHQAIGFAVYTEELERAFSEEKTEEDKVVCVSDKTVSDALFEVVGCVQDGLYVKAVTEVENA